MGTIVGIKGEVEVFIRQKIESCMAKMNLVTREEFELVKELAVKARMEQEHLAKRLAELEKKAAHNDE